MRNSTLISFLFSLFKFNLRQNCGRRVLYFAALHPDLNDLATYGDSLADAFAMAQEACGQYLFASLRDGEPFPDATPLESVPKDDDAALANLICVNLDEFARAYDDKAVKKTIRKPAWPNTAF